MATCATVRKEVHNALSVCGESPWLADGFSLLGLKTQSTTVKIDPMQSELRCHFLHCILLPQFVVGGPFEDNAPLLAHHLGGKLVEVGNERGELGVQLLHVRLLRFIRAEAAFVQILHGRAPNARKSGMNDKGTPPPPASALRQ